MQINPHHYYQTTYSTDTRRDIEQSAVDVSPSMPASDTVSISSRAYQAFEKEQLAREYKPGEVMEVVDNRSRNYQAVSREEFLKNITQGILDQRTGIDREKLNELEAKMAEIADNPNLTEKQKEEMLAALEEERLALLEEAAKRREEAERREEFQNDE